MIKSVKKAMDILTVLSATSEKPITLQMLAERTGMNKSTCAHIVDTLCDTLYVERVSRTQGYRLGPWAYMLSRYGRYQNTLVSISTPVLKWLYAKTNATVFISVVCNGYKYIVYHIDKAGILPMSDGSIIQGFLETTATGLLLMAHMDAETLNHALSHPPEEDSPYPSLSAEELQIILQKIRADEYAYRSVDLHRTQSYAFGVSLQGSVVAAIGILYPNAFDSAEYRSDILKAGKKAAKEIGRRLEFTS